MKRNMEQPLFTINSTFSEEEVVRFNKYVILHMFHYVRNVVICNIILLLFTVGMIVNDITSEDFPIGSIMMFLLSSTGLFTNRQYKKPEKFIAKIKQ